MKKAILFILAMLFLSSCINIAGNDREQNIQKLKGDDFLIFGHFYGRCVGENCIKTFKISSDGLYEDVSGDRNYKEMNFVQLPEDIYQKVKNLPDYFPSKLLDETDSTIGCPDCADGGGIYILYSVKGKKEWWKIDKNKANIPNYLHPFIDKVQDKINIITNH